MPTKPIDRLLFAQGGACFFCKQPLPKGEASVEHLVAQTHGGSDSDENCVACCTSLNKLFGRISLKEKIQVVLNQKGNFNCPRSLPSLKAAEKNNHASKNPNLKLVLSEPLEIVVEDLRKRGNSRPSKPDRLLNTIRAALSGQGQESELAESIYESLFSRGYAVVKDSKVEYTLPKRSA